MSAQIITPNDDAKSALKIAGGLAVEQIKMAAELIEKAIPGDQRRNSPEVLAAVIQAIATNYLASKQR